MYRCARTSSRFPECNLRFGNNENLLENYNTNIRLGFGKCVPQPYFHWVSFDSIHSNECHCKVFLTDLSVQIKPNARLWWGGKNLDVSAREIPLQNLNETMQHEDGFHFVNLTERMSNLTEFNVLIKAHVIDTRRCAGNESTFTYNGKLFPLFIL